MGPHALTGQGIKRAEKSRNQIPATEALRKEVSWQMSTFKLVLHFSQIRSEILQLAFDQVSGLSEFQA